MADTTRGGREGRDDLDSPTAPDDLAALRRDYQQGGLTEDDAGDDPVALFRRWFDTAREAGVLEPNAMVLSTVDPDGAPSARAVLLKGLAEDGFVFYTNDDSRKGRALAAEPRCALTFTWLDLQRQVRVEGTAEQVAAEVSDAYFASRPRDSRLGAWASPQSSVVADRAELEASFAAARDRFGDGPVPRPSYWGGWAVRPERIEFWQGRHGRMHDRFAFTRSGEGWGRVRLAP
ncbi:MAG: pyridoxamine 5'-phosphate oxidase [Marmoricola sp.]